MTWSQFEVIMRCLHVTNPISLENDKASALYDKIGKVRWLVEECRANFKSAYNLGMLIIVDEMMLWYKGQVLPIWQYMLAKPVKWRVKVWCVMDSNSKCVWDFSVFEGVSKNGRGPLCGKKGEGLQGSNVVKNLVLPLHGRGHVVVMDNFFTSIPLLMHLQENGTYAMGTVCSNHVGIPIVLKDKKNYLKTSPK